MGLIIARLVVANSASVISGAMRSNRNEQNTKAVPLWSPLTYWDVNFCPKVSVQNTRARATHTRKTGILRLAALVPEPAKVVQPCLDSLGKDSQTLTKARLAGKFRCGRASDLPKRLGPALCWDVFDARGNPVNRAAFGAATAAMAYLAVSSAMAGTSTTQRPYTMLWNQNDNFGGGVISQYWPDWGRDGYAADDFVVPVGPKNG